MLTGISEPVKPPNSQQTHPLLWITWFEFNPHVPGLHLSSWFSLPVPELWSPDLHKNSWKHHQGKHQRRFIRPCRFTSQSIFFCDIVVVACDNKIDVPLRHLFVRPAIFPRPGRCDYGCLWCRRVVCVERSAKWQLLTQHSQGQCIHNAWVLFFEQKWHDALTPLPGVPSFSSWSTSSSSLSMAQTTPPLICLKDSSGSAALMPPSQIDGVEVETTSVSDGKEEGRPNNIAQGCCHIEHLCRQA